MSDDKAIPRIASSKSSDQKVFVLVFSFMYLVSVDPMDRSLCLVLVKVI